VEEGQAFATFVSLNVLHMPSIQVKSIPSLMQEHQVLIFGLVLKD